MSGETLKPCPWCNSKAVLWKADNHEEWFIGCGGECSVNPGRHFDTREDAIAAWNTRHAPTVEGGELVERLRTELAEAKDAARRSDQHAQRVAVEAADGFAAMEALDEFWDAVGHPNNRGTLTPAEQVASICRELDQAAAALASRDAEIERLSAALGEAERAINRAKEAVEDQDDIELVGSLAAALSTLKTAREGDNA